MSGTGPGVPPLFVYRFKSNPPALGGRLLKKGTTVGIIDEAARDKYAIRNIIPPVRHPKTTEYEGID